MKKPQLVSDNLRNLIFFLGFFGGSMLPARLGKRSSVGPIFPGSVKQPASISKLYQEMDPILFISPCEENESPVFHPSKDQAPTLGFFSDLQGS